MWGKGALGLRRTNHLCRPKPWLRYVSELEQSIYVANNGKGVDNASYGGKKNVEVLSWKGVRMFS